MAGIVATMQSFFNLSAPGENQMEEPLFQSTRCTYYPTNDIEQ